MEMLIYGSFAYTVLVFMIIMVAGITHINRYSEMKIWKKRGSQVALALLPFTAIVIYPVFLWKVYKGFENKWIKRLVWLIIAQIPLTVGLVIMKADPTTSLLVGLIVGIPASICHFMAAIQELPKLKTTTAKIIFIACGSWFSVPMIGMYYGIKAMWKMQDQIA